MSKMTGVTGGIQVHKYGQNVQELIFNENEEEDGSEEVGER
jgi:hypothetical protein